MARVTHIRWWPRVGLLAGALLLAACMPARPTAAPLEFVVVRHAEKASDDPRDPTLSAAGRARAQRLADSLAARRLAAVYATGYRRTRESAAATAAAHGLEVTAYDAGQDAGTFATALRQRHASGTVLVVGHSNTVPAIAAALCGCAVAPLGDDEFDRRLTVRFDRGGRATLSDVRVP